MENQENKPVETISVSDGSNTAVAVNEKTQQLVRTIDTKDINSIVNYGLEIQNKLGNNSSQLLDNIRSSDSGEVGSVINELLQEIDYIDVDPSDAPWTRMLYKVPVIGTLMKKAKQVKTRYQKVSKNVDDIVVKLDKTRLTLFKDNNVLDHTFDNNVEYINELQDYIAAAKVKVQDMEEEIKAFQPKEEYDYQVLNDMKNAQNILHKKITNLEITRTVTLQSLPQIRVVQNNNIMLIDKVQSTVNNTIPLWKNQLVIAIALDKTRKGLEIQKSVDDATNSMLSKNSDLVKQNSIEAARQNERSIVDIETVRKINQDLIKTLDEVMRIKEDGKQKRAQITKELEAIDQELRDKIMKTKTELQK